ncbi:MAG: terminase small subunit [Patescibacteria group bacterium]|nr:terminase small subunit [Patescibacteria group bacterium]
MARTLTKKQRKFVNAYVEGKPGVKAALEAYDTEKYNVANAIATENLQKPAIVAELHKLGFDSNNAKRVVGEILNDDTVEPTARLNAADKVFKVNSDYAPERRVNLNLDADLTERESRIGETLARLLS